jgi:hypothetical protein
VTLPALITVTGIIKDHTGPVAGRISFVRSAVLFPTDPVDDNLLIPEEVVATIGVDGVLEQPLYASNDPAASPTGWTWEVRPFFPHWKTSFSIVVPYNAPGQTVGLNDLAPVPPNGTGQLYALANHTHSGGGGGGAVDSVFGRTGAVLAQTGDYTKTQVGLGNVDNTSDVNKPVSTAQSNAITAAFNNAQPLDPDLTTLAGLAATSGNTIMAGASGWASKTPAQVRAANTTNALVLLGPLDPVPGGLPAGTVIVRTT